MKEKCIKNGWLLRVVALVLLVAIISAGFAGCGSSGKKQIDSAIQGTWVFTNGLWIEELTFKKGKVHVYYKPGIGSGWEYNTTYTIDTNKEVIEFINDYASYSYTETVDYSYNSKTGDITLWLNNQTGVR